MHFLLRVKRVATDDAVFTWQLWDLTAGKLMHDFKYHEGQVHCVDFHPHEFLLATGILHVLSFRHLLSHHPGFS